MNNSCDVGFEVEGHIIPAHRQILSLRSKWFQALLSDHWKESNKSTNDNNNNNNTATSALRRIPIQDIRVDIFQWMMEFIYVDDLDYDTIEPDKIPELLMAADQFSMTRLKVIHSLIQYKYDPNDNIL